MQAILRGAGEGRCRMPRDPDTEIRGDRYENSNVLSVVTEVWTEG